MGQWLEELAARVRRQIAPALAAIDATYRHNQVRVHRAFIAERVSDAHFAGTTGYGYGDTGRETLDRLFAGVVGCEAALVRTQFVSGTHAIATALYGTLKGGDRAIIATGPVYDTLQPVCQDLSGLGVDFKTLESPDPEALRDAMDGGTRLVYIQRSAGYAWRRSPSLEQVTALAAAARRAAPDCVVLVDNCYAEFVATGEPGHAGADLCAGSLIKNPGGGLAPAGGYIAGRADLVGTAAARLTAPGLGAHLGPTLGANRLLFQGLYLAPLAVREALAAACFAAALFSDLGYPVLPAWDEPRAHIVQGVLLGSREKLLAFCRAIQAGSPVNSFVTPEPGPVPGYGRQVIMAAGTFIQGASLELSADAPLAAPWAAYLQGGLTRAAAEEAILAAAAAVGPADQR